MKQVCLDCKKMFENKLLLMRHVCTPADGLNKVTVREKDKVYIVLGVKKIIERMFGLMSTNDVFFKVENEDTINKTITIKLVKKK